VRTTLAHARLVLANSSGTAARCRQLGAIRTRVVHLGTDLPAQPAVPPRQPTIVTVGNLVARKRHADVIEALAILRERHPEIRYVIAGDGPERESLRALAASLGVQRQVDLRGRLPHDQAVAAGRGGSLFVLPSVAEAFGVAYVEAMAAGVPAIGCRGEDGPEEIAAAGGGIALVAPRDPPGLAATIDALLSDPLRLQSMGHEARATVAREFTWEHCGVETVRAYRDVLGG
jgi:teichuronic acid biosynthesis glycosyltransferase TuaC